MRKPIISLLAAVALAVPAFATLSAAAPSAAQAAACTQWQLPVATWWNNATQLQDIKIFRRDGWTITLRRPVNGSWRAHAWNSGEMVHGATSNIRTVTQDWFTFNTRWPNGINSVYQGTIRSDGSISGTMVERHGAHAYRTVWNMTGRAVCVQ